MAVVLGIDAAWTPRNPSGVALAINRSGVWSRVAIAPSYESFISLANGTPVNWGNGRFRGSNSDIKVLLQAAEAIAGSPVDVVAIDMPVSRISITGRRSADRLISQSYGCFGASTHSPTKTMPGDFGTSVTNSFNHQGFDVCPNRTVRIGKKPLIEVYPHTALIELLKLDYRLEYKVSKSNTYWRGKSHHVRINNLLSNMQRAYKALVKQVPMERSPGCINFPRKPSTLSSLKCYEDALDALVCAWVGICFLEGHAQPYGDNNAAIWVPKTVE